MNREQEIKIIKVRNLWEKKHSLTKEELINLGYDSWAIDEAEKQIQQDKQETNRRKKLKHDEESKKHYESLDSIGLVNILGLTVKKDNTNKLITFQAMLSAYTEDSQLNISNNAPSSTGKSYIPMEIKQLFPKEDVIVVGYCSPTAFFHDYGEWDKNKKIYTLDLSRKILIFLDQPHSLLLQHLRPILSHDEKEIRLKITDKSQKHGMRTKNIIVRGFPTVIFCSAGLSIDEQEATRFILLSPETTQEKIKEAINERIKRSSNKKEYNELVEATPERIRLKERIIAIRYENIQEIIVPQNLQDKIKEEFYKRVKILKPRYQRDIGRIMSFVKVFALLNVWYRVRKQNGCDIEANEQDIKEAFNIWDEIAESQELNLPPYVYNIYKEVIIPKYEKTKQGLSRTDILQAYFETYGRPLPEWMLRQQIIPMLESTGLISQEPDQKDKRKILTYPTTLLTVYSKEKNYSELKGGVSEEINVEVVKV